MAELRHLALRSDWAEALRSADRTYRTSTCGATLDEVGFIHLSFPHQLDGVAERFFDGIDDLVVLHIEPGSLDVRVEGGFPHLYGPLPLASVTQVTTYR